MKIAKTILRPDNRPDGHESFGGSEPSADNTNPDRPQASRSTSSLSPTISKNTRRILRLTRSAERLDRVERELIRKISHSFEVDNATQKLLTELRMSTNRLRGQISEMERADSAEETVAVTNDSL